MSFFTSKEYISYFPETIPSCIGSLPKKFPVPDVEIKGPDPMMEQLMIQLLAGTMALLTNTLESRPGSVLERFDRWWETSNQLLEGHTFVPESLGDLSLNDLWQAWQAGEKQWRQDPNQKAQALLAGACIKALPEILTGRLQAEEVMFPNASMNLVEGVYKNNVFADLFNDILGQTVTAYIRRRIDLDPSVSIRILEIGAGTGGTTAGLLEKLIPLGSHMAEYCYTDLSKAFLLHAEEHYLPGFPFLTPRIFNVEQPIHGQKIEPDQYDLVIAANVLHATRDIRRTLRNAKAALKKNGILLLNEITGTSLFGHLTFGLLEGWWRYGDDALRVPGSPALSAQTWARVLEEEGFDSFFSPGGQAMGAGQQIFAAESDGIVRMSRQTEPIPEPVAQPVPKTIVKAVVDGDESFEASLFEASLGEKSTRHLVRLVAKTLKMPPHRIDPSRPLEAYGVDSILVVQLTNALRKHFPDVSNTLFFEVQTIDALVKHLMETDVQGLRRLTGATEPQVAQTREATDTPVQPEPVSPPVVDEVPAAKIRIRDIAIIGLSGRFPQADDVDVFWENLKSGKNCITQVPADRWDWRDFQDEGVSKWGGFLRDVDKFDPLFFEIAPSLATQMDPQERLFIETVYHCIEDAGYTPTTLGLNGTHRTGVFAGVMNNPYTTQAVAFSIANRVSYLLDLHGPSLAVDTACSASLTAIHLALESLYLGTSDTAIAGGVNLNLHPGHYRGLSAAGMLSTGDRCRAFGRNADGFVAGEGVGAVLLKPLERAMADRDHIYGVIKASMLNAGGKTNGFTVPNPRAQSRLIVDTLDRAGVGAGEVSYIEAHGTGTALGDPIEISGLTRAFEQSPRASALKDRPHCRIGSVKTNIGHCESAAGIAGLTKILLQLKHGMLVPSLHAEQVNPLINFEKTPFTIQQKVSEWHPPDGRPRIAGLSSFGAGGANAHMIIAEHREPEPRSRRPEAQTVLIVLSAKTEAQLREYAARLLAFVRQKNPPLTDLAFTLQVGRQPMEARLGLVVRTRAELADKLDAFLRDDAGAEDLFWGQPHGHTDAFAVLTKDDDMTVLVATWIRKKKYGKLLELWVKGLDVDWQQLYTGLAHMELPCRISAPVYPFAKERYWQAPHGNMNGTSGLNGRRLHPLLHENISDFSGQRYESLFTGTEFFLQDHRINGRKVLPGVAYLEMAREALARALPLGSPEKRLSLKNVVWARGITVEEHPVKVETRLFPTDSGEIAWEIHGMDGKDNPLPSSQGIACLETPENRIGPDLDALRKTLDPTRLTPDQCYEIFQTMGIDYGPGHQAIDKLWLGDQVLARLCVAPSKSPSMENGQYTLHPGILDAAIQASIGLSLAEKDTPGQGGATSLPFALDRIDILEPCTPVMWAWVRLAGTSNANSGSKLRKVDIDLCDDHGNIRVALRGLASRETGTPPVRVEKKSSGDDVTNYLKKQLSTVIDLPIERIQANAPLEKYGIDSIIITQLTANLEKDFGSLPKTLFFEYQTLAEVSRYFLENHGSRLPGPKPVKTVAPLAVATPVTPCVKKTAPSRSDGDVAIIGLSGKYPGAQTPEEFWQNLRDGKDCITEIPKDRWDWQDYYTEDRTQLGGHYSKWGGFITDVDKFDPLFFNISPREAQIMDPQERLFLEHAWIAMEDAGYQRRDLPRDGDGLAEKAGVYAGVMYGHYQLFGIEEGLRGNPTAPGGSYSSIANRVSYILNLHGPSITVDTMCSGSLTTIHMACQDLRHKRIDLGIAGGVNLSIHPHKYLGLSMGQFISSKGRCLSFGEGSDGYIPGEGVGVLILKRLDEARRDKDHIYGVIKGSAVNHGGKTNGYSVPNPKAQSAVITRALEDGGIDPATVSYVEAHGTGTQLGDPIEIAGLAKALATNKACQLGSAKSNIGHCEGAAGIAGVTKVLLQLKHGKIAPSLHSRVLNPNIDFDKTPFCVNQELRPWERPVINGLEHPRIAGISAFGAGGSNAHILIQEYKETQPKAPEPEPPPGPGLIVLSARDNERLHAYADRLLRFIKDQGKNLNLPDLAHTLQRGREAMAMRLACLANTIPELIKKLERYLQGDNTIEAFYLGHANPDQDASPFDDDPNNLEQGRLLERWVAGAHVDWQRLKPYEGRKISAPTYPFAKQSYWVVPRKRRDREAPRPTSSGSQGNLGTLMLTPCWQQNKIALDGPGTAFDDHRVFSCGFEQPDVPGVVVTPLDSGGSDASGQFEAAALKLFQELRAILRDKSGGRTLIQVLVPAQGVGRVFAGLSGLLKSAGMENPKISGQVIALDDWPGLPEQLPQIGQHPAHQLLLYKEGRFFSSGFRPLPQTMSRPLIPWKENGTYLITGGAGGLGLIFAREIAQKTDRVHLILTGRTPEVDFLGAPGQKAKLDMMSKPDGSVEYRSVNMADASAVRELIHDIGVRFGEVDGIIHSAGVIRDNFILKKTPAEFKQVLAPKVAGVLNLDRVTRDMDLDFFVLFSSASGVTGNVGQSDYASANAFMDAFSAHRNTLLEAGKRRGQTLSINWPLWRDGGMGVPEATERKMREEMGIVPLETLSGITAFYQSLASGQSQTVVTEGDLDRLKKALSPLIVEALDDSINDKIDDNIEEKAAAYFKALISRTLSMPMEEIDIDTPLDRYGLDSVLAMSMTNELEAAFGSLPKTLFFEYGDVRALNAYFLESHPEIFKGLTATPAAQEERPKAEESRVSPAFGLSKGQQTLLFLNKLNPESAAYNIGGAFRITSELDIPILKRTFQLLLARHGALRTTFFSEEGRFLQRVDNGVSGNFKFKNQTVPGMGLEEIRAKVNKAQKIPFDLEKGPLIRANLYQRGPLDHILLITISHIISDAFSFFQLLDELWKTYAAIKEENMLPSPAPVHEYRDFVQWQDDMLKSKASQGHHRYWSAQLAGDLPVLNVKTDRPRPPVQTNNGATWYFTPDPKLTDPIKGLAAQTGCTQYMVLLAAFQILLHRYSGQDDIIVGSPTSGRTQKRFSNILGYFVNPVALRADFSSDPRGIDFLKSVRVTVLSALEHQDYPLLSIIEDLRLERDPSRSPLFQVMFNYMGASAPSMYAQMDMALKPFEITQQEGQFDFTLSLEEGLDGIRGSIDYNTDLFDEQSIIRMGTHYMNILVQLVMHPETPVSRISFLTPEEHRLQAEWNIHPTRKKNETGCVHKLFEKQAKQAPDAVAVVGKTPGTALTYGRLNEKANQLAHYLCKAGVRANTIAGIALGRSPEAFVAILAVLKAGGAFATIDPDLPEQRRKYILEDAGIKLILTDTAISPKFADTGIPIIDLDKKRTQISRKNKANLRRQVRPGDLAYVIYTSGSTGQPKGTLIEHRSWAGLYHALNHVYQLDGASMIFLQIANVSFDVFLLDFIRALASGGKLVLCEKETLLDPEMLYQLMRREKVCFADFVPAVINSLLPFLAKTGNTLEFMKVIIVGSDVFYTRDYHEIKKFLNPETRLVNAYGLTESTIDNLWFEAPLAKPVGTGSEIVPIGRPLPNSQAYILDRHLQPVPMGVPGELCLGGPCIGRGYLNRPDLTEKKFISNPFSKTPGARLFQTGDLVCYQPDGMIHFIGRRDSQLKIRGFRVEAGEIESVLLQAPGVKEAAVAAKTNNTGTRYLAGYVVPKGNSSPAPDPLTPDRLRAWLKDILPAYMVPAKIVMLNEMPLSPSGKIDRKALPVPDFDDSTPTAYVEPATETEEIIARVWAQTLGLKRAGRYEDFFDSGGDSLLGIKALAGLKEHGIRVSPRMLFLNSRVADLARAVREPQSDACQVRIFFVPGLDQSVFDTVPLENNLPHTVRLHTLLPFDDDGDRFLYTRLDRMAAGYLERIKAIQPQGPYHFMGYSWGGKVMVELVKRLIAEGEQVSLAALIDSYYFNFNTFTPDQKRFYLATAHFFKVSYLFSFLGKRHGLELPPGEVNNHLLRMKGMDNQEMLAYLKASVRMPGKEDPTKQESGNRISDRSLLQYLDTIDACEKIDRDPSDLDFNAPPMIFFSATQKDPDSQAIRRFMEESVDLKVDSKDVASGPVPGAMSAIDSWALFKKNFEAVKIRAGHRSILSEPHVKIITDYVMEKLLLNQP